MRNVEQIANVLGVSSDLTKVDVKALGSNANMSKLTHDELMAFSKAIAEAQNITVQEDKVVDAKGDELGETAPKIGDCFASQYFPFGKLYGTPFEVKTAVNQPQLCLALIPKIIGFHADPEKWDVPVADYAQGDWEESVVDGKPKKAWDKVVDALNELCFRIDPSLLKGQEVTKVDKKSKKSYTTYCLDISPREFLENLKVEESVGFFKQSYPASVKLTEMQGHLSEAHTLQIKINRRNGRVFFFKKHSSRMATSLYIG